MIEKAQDRQLCLKTVQRLLMGVLTSLDLRFWSNSLFKKKQTIGKVNDKSHRKQLS